MPHTLFISDIHLSPEREDITQVFLYFLKAMVPASEALYILGDFFEIWIGDDAKDDLHGRVSDALSAVHALGIPVYLMHGNRDFLIGPDFIKRSRCILLEDPSVIDLYGRQTLLMHGDSLCCADRRFQIFRKHVRNPKYQRFFLALPVRLRRAIARRIRRISYKRTQVLSEKMMDVTPRMVSTSMQKYGAWQMIHGHTHRRGFHEVQINKKAGMRVVLNDWYRKGGALKYDAKHGMTWIDLPFF